MSKNKISVEEIKLLSIEAFFMAIKQVQVEKISGSKPGVKYYAPTLTNISSYMGITTPQLKKAFTHVDQIGEWVCEAINKQIRNRITSIIAQSGNLTNQQIFIALFKSLIDYFGSNSALIAIIHKKNVDFIPAASLDKVNRTVTGIDLLLHNDLAKKGISSVALSQFLIFLLGLLQMLGDEFSSSGNPNLVISFSGRHLEYCESFVKGLNL